MNYAIQTSTVGTVLWVPDQWGKGRRPHLVVAKDNQGATVCPLTHTPQPGDWATDELGRPTHIAAYNKFSGSWNLTWIDFQTELEIEQPAHSSATQLPAQPLRRWDAS